MTDRSVIKIDEEYKNFVIRWQSWLQAKTGKYISQGAAVAIACWFMQGLLDMILLEAYKRELKDISSFLETLAEAVVRVAERLAEGELKDFDFEGLLAKILEK